MSRDKLSRRHFLGHSAAAVGALGLIGQESTAAENNTPMQVKIGINLLLYTVDLPVEKLDLIARMAELGYDGVEIPLAVPDTMDTSAIRRALEKAGIEATTSASNPPTGNIISPDAAVRRAGDEHYKRIIGLAAEIGAHVITGPMYSPISYITGRWRTEEEWKRSVEHLRKAAETAAAYDIILTIEPLNRFETFLINTAADAVAFIKAVDHPNLRIQLDTFHMNIEELNTGAAIRKAGKYLGHFHASENNRGIPGTGQVPWKEVFAALREIGWQRWVTIESFASGIRELAAAASVWRPLYPSADELARQGLAFIRKMAGRA